ncbi:hypothetical protein XBJ2_1300052 [Xenorhabdus bovienii str. Jollieti]|uniref:Uncharacterized protein n=1 Tax=Xenorhabdus bovienii (strain SS-2004) TaxID=406818 RepID=D3V1R2_XENBS|nr:hypothetical protein [Xenorhabdus bovienii]CBJ81606.1 hypothetical protein XBJ1_2482 [Xenorhabdus bovienii SS-2004]CDH27501.1 hypothetical protein XBJ2_1300052 [Xenorhabdus bovienii str. Jollieti]
MITVFLGLFFSLHLCIIFIYPHIVLIERYQQIEWLSYVASEIHRSLWAFSPAMEAPESYPSITRHKLL